MSRLNLNSNFDIGHGSQILLPGGTSTPFASSQSTVFNGTSSYVQANSASLNMGWTQAQSWMIWIKWTSNGQTNLQWMWSNYTNNNPPGYAMFIDKSNPEHWVWNVNGSDASFFETDKQMPSAGNWHQIIWTYSGNKAASGVTVYYDGVAQTPTIDDAGPITADFLSTVAPYFGTDGLPSSTSRFFSGRVNTSAFFNKVLSSSDATALYNSGTPVDLRTLSCYSNCTAWWWFGSYPTDTTSNIVNVVNPGTGDLACTSITFTTDSP